jgi:chemotaxis response regulator CheB
MLIRDFAEFIFEPYEGGAGRAILAATERAMERTIRVLVANRPRLMRELIVATFADQPDIEIVGEVENEEEIPSTVEKTAPHLIVIALDDAGQRPRICDTVLRRHPDVKIIGIATKNNYSVFYWATLDIHSSDIEASEEGLLSAARGRTDLVQ